MMLRPCSYYYYYYYHYNIVTLIRLTVTANHPDKQKIRIIEFFFENRLHWQFEVKKKILKRDLLDYIYICVQAKH